MNTDTYLNMPSVPAGAILGKIAQKRHLPQAILAQKSGLIPQRINDLIMGRRMPENLSVRFRVPLVWGGTLDIDNLFMCMTFPHSHNMDRFIIEQSGNDIIWMPNPAKKVYLPAHMMNGGDGGNATSDRLSQLAAQIAASRGME